MQEPLSVASARSTDDRLDLLIRLAYTPLALLTAIFGPPLFLFPGSTADFWAWTIRPDMSAVWVGVAYTFGAIAITAMLIVGRWSSAFVPVLSTWPFSVVMLAATLIHHDRFFEGTVEYYVWLGVYVLLPIVLPAILWLNRDRAPAGQPGDLFLPATLRTLLAAGGVLVAALAAVLVLAPSVLADAWPWQLTPLMSRVVGGWLLFIATGAIAPLFQARYVTFRFYFPTASLWFAILLVASLLNRDDFRDDRVATPLYFAGVAATAVGLAALSVLMERRYRMGNQG